MRIARYLARCGVASRRESETLVTAGRVCVNGAVVTNLATQVRPDTDSVTLDGKPLLLASAHLTLAMNKPVGVLVSRRDTRGRRTIYDILPPPFVNRARELVYAGRLDYSSSGLLIITTDGDLANQLVHPRHHVEKTYDAETSRPLKKVEIEQLRAGVVLGEDTTLPCTVKPLGPRGNGAVYRITLREGKNRQIRRMIQEVGARVVSLERIAIGRLELKKLFPSGAQGVVELSPRQIELLIGAVHE